MAVTFGTAHISKGREITKKGHRAVDITMKSGMALFAPTKDLVYGYKYHGMSEKEYTRRYRSMMWESYYRDPEQWHDFIKEGEEKITFLMCFCPTGFCHRHLLKPMLEEIATKYLNLEVKQVSDWKPRQQNLSL